MRSLVERYGFPQEVVDIWLREEGETLLEVQLKAIQDGLFDGINLLVTAPSSSGKTLIGEMAALRGYFNRKKTVFLVPMKALAEEKYADFQRKYGQFGLRIAVSSHDRTEYDQAIVQGYFDLAIVVFEKMSILLTQSPSMMNSCGLIVVDEVQLINDRSRGPELEILLTKILMLREKSPDALQVLCLSAVLGELHGFDEWLGARRCVVEKRPLDLRETVLDPDGNAKIRCFNSGQESTERVQEVVGISIPSDWKRQRDIEPSILKRLESLCRKYLTQGKHVLIFRKWRNLARETALWLASSLQMPAASLLIRQLSEHENSNALDALVECLSHGVAFHTADLGPETRLAIERDFRSGDGEARVICATSTLAMGVNLPSSIVIIPDTFKPDPESQDFHEVPITPSEYKNMSGRAGRTRYGEEGTSILLANSKAEAARYWAAYVKGRLDRIQPSLRTRNLRRIALSLIAGGLCDNETDVYELLLHSYTGYKHWNTAEAYRRALSAAIREAVEYNKSNGLLEESSANALKASKLGQLCAASGVEVETFVLLRNAVLNLDPGAWSPWQVIFPALHASELDDQFRIYVRGCPPDIVSRLEEASPHGMTALLQWSRRTIGEGGARSRVCAYFILLDWIEGVEMRRIENSHYVQDKYVAATIRHLSEYSSWLVQTMARIAGAIGLPQDLIASIEILAERLTRGVPAEGLEIADLRVAGVHRGHIKRLVDAGLSSLDNILETPSSGFRNIISPALGMRIQEAILAHGIETLKRDRQIQILRLQKCGFDPALLSAIYEETGTSLEVAVVNLLNAQPLELGVTHITDQKHGEPDLLLSLESGNLVGSVTASDHPISSNKSAEILRSGGRYNPKAFVVFGRPRFHDQAIKDALHISGNLDASRSYKLISISDLGELYVRCVEKRLSRGRFIEILMTHEGLILAKHIQDDPS